MSLIRRPSLSLLAPAGGPTTGPGGGAAEGEDVTCVRCGATLPPLGRRRQKVCRVCATQQAQSYLRDALANRRRRRPLDPEDVPPTD